MSGFPEKGADLLGSPGNFRGSPGKSGKLPGISGLLLSSTVKELPGSRQGTSGEVRGLSRSSGGPDSRACSDSPNLSPTNDSCNSYSWWNSLAITVTELGPSRVFSKHFRCPW